MNNLFELVAGLVLAAGGVYFVLRPILTPATADSGVAGTAEYPDPEDDLSPRAVALRALKEIEFDRATGKLADGDYETLTREYTAAALEALRAEEAAPAPAAPPASSPVPKVAPAAGRVCPTHGPRSETDAAFCSECGARLTTAAGFCSRCGTALEPEAKFCARCGDRVAA